MKKLLLPLFAMMVMTSMSSCLFKTYNCECTTVGNNGTSIDNHTVYGGLFSGGKSSAQNQCKEMESSSSFGVTTCKFN